MIVVSRSRSRVEISFVSKDGDQNYQRRCNFKEPVIVVVWSCRLSFRCFVAFNCVFFINGAVNLKVY